MIKLACFSLSLSLFTEFNCRVIICLISDLFEYYRLLAIFIHSLISNSNDEEEEKKYLVVKAILFRFVCYSNLTPIQFTNSPCKTIDLCITFTIPINIFSVLIHIDNDYKYIYTVRCTQTNANAFKSSNEADVDSQGTLFDFYFIFLIAILWWLSSNFRFQARGSTADRNGQWHVHGILVSNTTAVELVIMFCFVIDCDSCRKKVNSLLVIKMPLLIIISIEEITSNSFIVPSHRIEKYEQLRIICTSENLATYREILRY